MNQDLLNKIDFVVNKISLQEKDFEHSLELSTNNIRLLQEKRDNNQKRYRYHLEKNNLEIMNAKAGMKKCNLFIKRCLAYKEYLKSLNQDNLILKEQNKFEFIKIFHEEAIHDLTYKIEKNHQERILFSITDSPVNLTDKNVLMEHREDIMNRFINSDFKIDDNKVMSTYYLNYDTEELVESLYPKKQRKKTS